MILNMSKCKGKVLTRFYISIVILLSLLSFCATISAEESYQKSMANYREPPTVDFENKIHQYYTKHTDDSFQKVSEFLTQKNTNELQFDSEKESLRNLLSDLNISIHSQALVFSNTSLQLSRISQNNPRAIFFNDNLYVGYVPGGFIEIIGIDPRIGAIPYVFKLPQKGDLQYPPIRRSTRCMRCHATKQTGGVPGLLLSSVIPAETGGSLDNLNPGKPGHHLPYTKRFGGWFLTNHADYLNKWSNSIGVMNQKGQIKQKKIQIPVNNISKYHLSNKSEMVTHLVMEHQIGFTNLCISAQYALRELKLPKSKSTKHQVEDYYIEQLLRYSLFVDEPNLSIPSDKETSTFITYFEKSYPKKNSFNLLRKIELKTRLFKTRCSYMLGSSVFKALPADFKNTFMISLKEIVSQKNTELSFLGSHLEDDERERILNVLSQE